MLEMMAALATAIVAFNAVADELAATASACHGQPFAEVMLGLSRRQRVKALEMQGQLAALSDAYAARFCEG